MNAVGIDVSKGKSMVAIMRPFGEIVSAPFEIKHTASDINSLVELINSVEGESRIVMEHTGRYYEALAHQLSEANLFVSAINPKLIKDFDNDSTRRFPCPVLLRFPASEPAAGFLPARFCRPETPTGYCISFLISICSYIAISNKQRKR